MQLNMIFVTAQKKNSSPGRASRVPRVSLAGIHPCTTCRPSSASMPVVASPCASHDLIYLPGTLSSPCSLLLPPHASINELKLELAPVANTPPTSHQSSIPCTGSSPTSSSIEPPTRPAESLIGTVSLATQNLPTNSNSAPHRRTSSSGHRFAHPTAQIGCK